MTVIISASTKDEYLLNICCGCRWRWRLDDRFVLPRVTSHMTVTVSASTSVGCSMVVWQVPCINVRRATPSGMCLDAARNLTRSQTAKEAVWNVCGDPPALLWRLMSWVTDSQLPGVLKSARTACRTIYKLDYTDIIIIVGSTHPSKSVTL